MDGPAQRDDLEALVLEQGDCDVRRARHHGRAQRLGQPPRELEHARAAAHDDDLAVGDEAVGRVGDRRLGRDIVLAAIDEAPRRGRRRQRAAMHAVDRARGGQLVEVAAHGVE